MKTMTINGVILLSIDEALYEVPKEVRDHIGELEDEIDDLAGDKRRLKKELEDLNEELETAQGVAAELPKVRELMILLASTLSDLVVSKREPNRMELMDIQARLLELGENHRMV